MRGRLATKRSEGGGGGEGVQVDLFTHIYSSYISLSYTVFR